MTNFQIYQLKNISNTKNFHISCERKSNNKRCIQYDKFMRKIPGLKKCAEIENRAEIVIKILEKSVKIGDILYCKCSKFFSCIIKNATLDQTLSSLQK